MLRQIAGFTLIAIPVGTGVLAFAIAFIELPPVMWTTILVGAAYAMIGAGNWLLKSGKRPGCIQHRK